MAALIEAFDERLAEVETYLSFLVMLEEQARRGPPRLEGAEHPITTQQQKILYSSVYLQLYNLVESTMTRCIDLVVEVAKKEGAWRPSQLADALRKEWVRATARTHIELTPVHRLDHALLLCNQLVASLPIDQEFSIDKGGGGNWDDAAIEEFSQRLGFALNVSQPVYSAVKRPVRDDLGPLALVKKLRNDLAHGSISFTECAENITVARLVELKDQTANYLREVVGRFVAYTENFEFLSPEHRPAAIVE
jgi:hypothetical protein